ncbi:MAG TPA: hypothetical protein VHF06_26715 [Pseudonocardiaceae bacterium]|jgi:hypothetical protein|nr:hypothetical protein [Pseudonocardiaceae bacterium]
MTEADPGVERFPHSGHDGKPAVLFLCVHNAGRSQMALGFFQHLAGDRAVAWSGGSEPGHEVNPSAVAAMAERGIDITAEFPKPWTDETPGSRTARRTRRPRGRPMSPPSRARGSRSTRAARCSPRW